MRLLSMCEGKKIDLSEVSLSHCAVEARPLCRLRML